MAISTGHWKNIKRRVEDLADPTLGFQVDYATHTGTRFTVKIQNETIWTFPDDFLTKNNPHHPAAIVESTLHWNWWAYESRIWDIYRCYVDAPKDRLLDPSYLETVTNVRDDYHLLDILRCADRRIGWRKLFMWSLLQETDNNPASKVLAARFKKT